LAHGAFAPLSPLHARIQSQLRASFDPNGVFHTGRLLPISSAQSTAAGA
jgi:FAD/FMN-containing dehydrogenase